MSRGFFRLWLVGAILWIAFSAFVGTFDSRPDAFWIYAKAALVPPLLVLVIGAGIGWALRGFRRRV